MQDNIIKKKLINDLGWRAFSILASISPFHLGIDISSEMITAAQSFYRQYSEARFITSSKPDQIADYGIASGIFNVRLGQNDADWSAHLQTTLDLLHETSHDGFAFNCLTSYSDKNKMRDYLYYANPCELFNYCKQRYSRQVALLHDYDLYEFTILVRKRS